MDIELIADTLPSDVPFDEGAVAIVDLLHRLGQLPQFSDGWRGLNGAMLADGEEAFLNAAREALSSDGMEIGMHTLVADSGLHARADGVLAEKYLVSAQFGKAQILPTHIRLGLTDDLARLDLFRAIVQVLLDWNTIQHVTISDPYYAFQDAPLDPRRRGIGWAGWVPFSLTAEQVSEAMVLETMSGGTFLACVTRWDANDGVSIPRAQALELQLNALGVLPTFDELGRGNWGRP